jgi:hypothetical protein
MTRVKRLSAKSLCVCCITALFLIAAPPSLADESQVYYNDFDGDPSVASGVTAALEGVTTVESTQGYAGLGFGGSFLRNTTGGDHGSSGPIGTPGSPTTLTLTGLPPHVGIDINFLLAIIDSWDGSEPGSGPGACTFCHPDILTVTVDGKIVFSEAFGFNGPVFTPPPGVSLVEYAPLGFNFSFEDSAYDMGHNPAFDGIPHMADTMTVEWFASGDGWQGGDDESWAIDNLEIVLHGGTPVAMDVKPQSCPNPLNALAKGRISVAVLGTGDLDVAQIDVDSIRLEGVGPIRSAIEDVATPFEPLIGKNEVLDCTDSGPDGFDDLMLKFDTQELVEALGYVVDGQVWGLTLTGVLQDGTPIIGEDVIVIVGSNK